MTKLKGGNNMKTKVILQIVAMLALAFASMSLVNISHMEDRQDQKRSIKGRLGRRKGDHGIRFRRVADGYQIRNGTYERRVYRS